MNSQIDEKDDTTFYMQEAFRRRLRGFALIKFSSVKQ